MAKIPLKYVVPYQPSEVVNIFEKTKPLGQPLGTVVVVGTNAGDAPWAKELQKNNRVDQEFATADQSPRGPKSPPTYFILMSWPGMARFGCITSWHDLCFEKTKPLGQPLGTAAAVYGISAVT